MNTAEYWREKLLSEKQELEALTEGVPDSQLRVDAAVGSERRRRMRIGQIEAAMKRLDTDDFGYCVRCGEKIADERVIADPASTLCLGCAGTPRR
jgi:RNA polymerase-binding transcription factor DksA